MRAVLAPERGIVNPFFHVDMASYGVGYGGVLGSGLNAEDDGKKPTFVRLFRTMFLFLSNKHNTSNSSWLAFLTVTKCRM